jgi:hypothetical protein
MNTPVHTSAVSAASDDPVGVAGDLCAFPVPYLGYAYFYLVSPAGDT